MFKTFWNTGRTGENMLKASSKHVHKHVEIPVQIHVQIHVQIQVKHVENKWK